jgi:hypothetical protein
MRTMVLFALVAGAALADPPAVGYGRGEVHPDFHLERLGGGRAHLSDFRGKRLLVFHFASW